MTTFDRRNFIIRGSAAAGFACLPSLWSQGSRAEAASPHYFLEIFIPGGLDPLYTFDSRPLAMTKAGLIANYMDEEPERLTGSNGNTAWATRLVKPLKAQLDRFSVLNGVIMVPGFDGHDNNINYFLSGNAFGGESLLPHLNQTSAPTPIDFVAAGSPLFANVTNAANSVPLTPKSTVSFAKRLARLTTMKADTGLTRFLTSRFAANAAGSGHFAAGAKAMDGAFAKVPELAESIKGLTVNDNGSDEVAKISSLIGELFRRNMCKSIQLVIDSALIPNTQVDTHDGKAAKDSPPMVEQYMAAVAKVLNHLRTTAFDAQNSLLDVTTVLVGSEFGRTMRSTYFKDISDSGTDHNPLKNTILIGGKGIKGGIIAGATDFQSADEAISGAHKGLDPALIKAMGRPLNFDSLTPAGGLPADYRAADYLDFSCIANTLYSLFKAPISRYRVIERNGPPAKVLTALLA